MHYHEGSTALLLYISMQADTGIDIGLDLKPCDKFM